MRKMGGSQQPLKYQRAAVEEDSGLPPADGGGDGFHEARPYAGPSSPSPSAFPLPWLRSVCASVNRYYAVLFFAILAISCSGTLLRYLPNTPPLLKAFWRLLFMSGVLSVGFVYQYVHADAALIDRFLSNDSLLTILVSGLAASAHFGFWIWSINHTSLAHSLFFVSTYPLVVVAVMLAQRKRIDLLEAVGVVLGLIGSAFLLADTSTSSDTSADEVGATTVPGVTFLGDLMAFLGAAVFVVYLYAGQRVRGWMPLFIYTFPMTFVSAVPLLFLTVAFESTTFAGFTPQSVFGFLAPSSLVVLLLIAALPAGMGHTGINFAVKKVSPLSISVVLTLEPVLGVVVGVVAGVEQVPGVLTIVGGPISMLGCIAAIIGTNRRERKEKALAEVAAHTASTAEVEGKSRADAEEEEGGEEGTEGVGGAGGDGEEGDKADSSEWKQSGVNGRGEVQVELLAIHDPIHGEQQSLTSRDVHTQNTSTTPSYHTLSLPPLHVDNG